MRYRPDLDGLRALAVLAVMAVHTGVWYCSGGWMGVDVFFVLSGFLITTLLVDEQRRSGTISFRRFYQRRALRLYPAFLAVVLSFGVLFALGIGYGPTAADYWFSVTRSIFYVEDFWAALGHQDAFHHGWSLAVEEQFYLLWPPILLLLLRRRRRPLPWVLASACLSWVVCAHTLSQGPSSLSAALFLPWNRMGPLLLGAALALVLADEPRAPAIIRSPAGGLLAAGAAVFVVAAGSHRQPYPNLAWETSAIAVTTCLVIWHLTANTRSPLRLLLASAPLRWLGRRSYAMYLIHLPLLSLIQRYLPVSLRVQCLLMVLLTVAFAGVSYTFVEAPFLRRKAHLQPSSAASTPTDDDPERGGPHSYLRVGIPLATK